MNKLYYITFTLENDRSECYFCVMCLDVPNRSRIKEKVRGTIKGPQWYGLGTRAPIIVSFCVIFLTSHNFSAPKFTKLMVWPNQDNDVTYVCAKQHFATMHILKTIFFIP